MGGKGKGGTIGGRGYPTRRISFNYALDTIAAGVRPSAVRRTRLRPMSAAKQALSAVYRALVELIRPFWPCCARCGRRDDRLEAHHPFKRGKGATAWKHLIVLPLCHRCHGWVHSHERQAREDGWLIEPRTASMYGPESVQEENA